MSKIEITINGKTHTFEAGDPNAIKDMPWQERKELIGILEQIKQVEYVDNKPALEKQGLSILTTEKQINPISSATATPAYDKAVKPGQGDVDSIMNRLIMEEKKHQSTVPDRGPVIKWMLAVIAVIMVLALLF